MRSTKTWVLGVVLCGALLCGANSQAGSISFLATGTFASSGTPTFDDGISTVNYSSASSSATVPPATNVSLGTFTTTSSASPSSPDPVSDTFTLTVTDLNAPFGSITFTGTMSGDLSGSTSSAFIQFSTPLTQTLDGFIFTIVSNDAGSAGRVNLNAPTTNLGVSAIEGSISVPEPASIVLLGLAFPALAGLAYRRTRR